MTERKTKVMQIRVVTLFPEMIRAGLSFGICGRALSRGLASVAVLNPRDFAHDANRTVDDRPYGGGPGMVLKYEPLREAVRAARSELPSGTRAIFLSPQGRRFDQTLAREMTSWPGLILVAGRYEGFDERIIVAEADDEISLGDFILSGGEVAALAVIDAVVRLLPGALGDDASAEAESFSTQLLDCPQYTRPDVVDGLTVPAVLIRGDHAAIRRWRLKQALGRTSERRPDLLSQRHLTAQEQDLLREYLAEGGVPEVAEKERGP
jgi:tRNA (guanine37-N1)-methyltransferase